MGRPQVTPPALCGCHGPCSQGTPNTSGILIDATTPWTQSGRVYVTANQNATGRATHICPIPQAHIHILTHIFGNYFYIFILRRNSSARFGDLAAVGRRDHPCAGLVCHRFVLPPPPLFPHFSPLFSVAHSDFSSIIRTGVHQRLYADVDLHREHQHHPDPVRDSHQYALDNPLLRFRVGELTQD